MPDDLSTRRRRALQDHYATDDNLRKRANIFEYLVATGSQPQLVDLFDWAPTATVLDVGCGNGLWTALAAQRTTGTVIGLDSSQGMLTALTARPEAIAAVLADGQCLPMRDDSVDIAIAAWVLYHLPDKAAALSEIRRVLRPGGRFIASTNSAEVLPTLDDTFLRCIEHVAGHAIDRWIEPLDFTIENGAAVLREWFGRVELIANESTFEIPLAEPILTFAESLRGPITAEVGDGFDFDSFLSELERALDARLASRAIRFTRRIGFFVASNAV
jgi:ubiquinone/menaquinone biosynthesis C-methylase UbiE